MKNHYKYDEYTDGSEEYLFEIFKNIKNISSYPTELQRYIKDWPTQYHLSYKRTNLLEGIKELFNNNWKVLELGGGTGILTHWLGDFFQKVDVVEGSYKRAKIIRERLKGKKNVDVIVDDIRTIDFSEKYNLILLVGVLEYVPYFSDTGDYSETCRIFLNKLTEYLKEDGFLLVAMENKLGAKYFAGCPEDHTGEIFYSLMGYPEHAPITFSKNEIENLLIKAGYEEITFYHLFPDYKFPVLFLRDDFYIYEVEPSGWLRGNFEDYSKKRLFLYPDVLLIDAFSKARLLQYFSNSFLILCTKKRGQIDRLKTNWIIKKFWNPLNIRPEFHHTVSLIKEGDKFLIERMPLKGNIYDIDLGDFRFQLTKSDEFKHGSPFLIEIYRDIMKKDYLGALTNKMLFVHNELLKRYDTYTKDNYGYPLIKGEAIDFTIWNLLKSDNTLIFFDKKWQSKNPLSSDFILFRSLFYLYQDIYPFLNVDCESFVITIINSIFPFYNKDRYLKNLTLENTFQNSISLIKNHRKNTQNFIDIPDTVVRNLGEYKLKELQNELNSIYRSRGWRALSFYYKIRDKIFRILKNL
ncbi:MAG: class I SAM-dependent methyltransferase [Syntrophorhabdaceae bacterium]|nr:class I SAM-dependent methyltransferase [Syntrophorhabdaceae bacterium]